MKPHKPFQIRDRFKGFKEEIEPIPPNPHKQFDRVFNGLIKEMYYGQRIMEIPSYRNISIGSSVTFDNMPIYNGIDMNHCIIEETESWPKECEHGLIDVGFTNPRMVCKKCDKDLK